MARRPHRADADRVGRARAPARAAGARVGSRARVRADGEIGRIWTVSRPLVYRAITVLRELGYVAERGSATSATGPQRVLLAPTPPAGRRCGAGSRARRARPRPPLGAAAQAVPPRTGRRATRPRCSALSSTLLERGEHALAARVGESAGIRPHRRRLAAFERARRASLRRGTCSTSGAASRSTTRRSATSARPTPHSTGCHCSRPQTTRARRGSCSRSLTAVARRPRRVLARLGARAPARVRRLGRHGRPVPRRPAARDVRDPLAAPAEPDLALALRARRGRGRRHPVAGLDLLDGTPVLDLKPYVPLFDTPTGPVSAGWFTERAALIFERTSDTRFRQRSTL